MQIAATLELPLRIIVAYEHLTISRPELDCLGPCLDHLIRLEPPLSYVMDVDLREAPVGKHTCPAQLAVTSVCPKTDRNGERYQRLAIDRHTHRFHHY